MAIKTFSDIVLSMTNFLRNLRPGVDLKVGNFVKDVVIDPPAAEIATLYRAIDGVSKAQSPDTATGQGLTGLAKNLQNPRKAAIKANGVCTFYRIQAPNGTITIPQGTVVSSKGSLSNSAVQFMTTQETTMSVVSFNADTARYEVSVPIRAVVAGASGNVSAGTVVVIVSALSDIVGCYNASATSGGADKETDTACASRVRNIYNGNNVGTVNGYRLAALSLSDVSDAVVVTPDNETIAKRASAGAVDILIRGAIPTQPTTEIYTYTTGTSYYIPEKQPLYADYSGSFVLQGSVTGVLTQGVHYTVTYDDSVLGGSIEAADRFTFIAGSGLSDGESISFLYTYNSLVENVQNLMDSDGYKAVTANVLVKAAKRRLINISATIEIFGGYTATDVKTNVANALVAALDAYGLGETVQQSDILSVITSVAGVDQVHVPLDVFEEDPATGTITQDPESGNLEIPANSYAVAGTIIIYVV